MRNRIENYYVVRFNGRGESPEAFRSPVTIPSSSVKVLLEKQFQINISCNPILHVCYDCDSGILYLPNSMHFSKKVLEELLWVAINKIKKYHRDFKFKNKIDGSPFSLPGKKPPSFREGMNCLIQTYSNY